MELLADNVWSEEYGIYLRLSGLLQMMKGDYEQARSICCRSIDTFRIIAPGNDDRYAINIAGAYNYIAESYRLEGSYDQAFLAYDQAIIYNRSRGYYPGAAVFYTNYGVAAFQKGEKEIAQQLFLFALETYRAAHEYSGRPIALSYLAFYEAEAGNFALAADYIREALQVSEMIGSPWWEGVTLYQCWNIRTLLENRGQDAPELASLWPASRKEHCLLCLSYLRQLQPRLETQEMEEALAELEARTAPRGRMTAGRDRISFNNKTPSCVGTAQDGVFAGRIDRGRLSRGALGKRNLVTSKVFRWSGWDAR